MPVIGWRTTGGRAGFLLAATTMAFAAGFLLFQFYLSIVPNAPVNWTLVVLVLAGVLVAAFVWLARRSQVAVAWLALPLLGAVTGGFLGYITWIISIFEALED